MESLHVLVEKKPQYGGERGTYLTAHNERDLPQLIYIYTTTSHGLFPSGTTAIFRGISSFPQPGKSQSTNDLPKLNSSMFSSALAKRTAAIRLQLPQSALWISAADCSSRG